jgi:hypothetical protein
VEALLVQECAVRLGAIGLGLWLQLAVWASAARTVFIPQKSSTWVVRWPLSMLTWGGLAVARHLPRAAGERLLGICAPASVFLVLATWLAGLELSFGLLVGILRDSDPMAHLFIWQGGWHDTGVLPYALVSVVTVVVMFAVYVAQFGSAYRRRELQMAKVMQVPDAETLVRVLMWRNQRDHVDEAMAEWVEWLAELRSAHTTHCALVYCRPSGRRCWLELIVMLLDAAALIEAIAPKWSPPHVRMVLETGVDCLQQMTRGIGVTVHIPGVSLHGREERGFADTMRSVSSASVPVERDGQQAWTAFQDLRTQYAPFATMIAFRLLYDRDKPYALSCVPPV